MKSKDPGSVTLSTLSPPLESDMWSQADLMDIPGLDISSESPVSDLSDDDSTADVSLELGRGAAKPARRLDDSRSSVMSFQNSVRSSSPAVRVEYPTPQKNLPIRSSTRRAVSENLRKDAQLRRANQAQKENSSKPQTKNRDQRRTLSDMHARVRDNYDGSFLGDERPAPMASNTRSTRFGNLNHSQEIADAVERASREAYSSERAKMNTDGTPRPTGNTNMGDTFTRNSFLLPDLPNLSELVSGVYEDGTPVLPPQPKMRSTRFASPPHGNADVSLTREHMPLDAIPIPEDEKALFVSLRLLQEKVTELERFKSNAEKKMEVYREENAALKAGRSLPSEKSAAREHDYKGTSNRSTREQQKLEAANIALQNQLDIADRKAQIQEAALQRLNQEREAAISQLGVAYLESRELKNENEALRQENAALKEQAARSTRRKTREQDTVESQESSAPSDADDSQQYTTEHSADVSRSTKDLTSKNARSDSKARRQEDSHAKISTQVNKEISRLEKERAEEALFSLDVPTQKRTSSTRAPKSDVARNAESKNARKSNTSKQRSKRVMVDDASGTVEATEGTKVSEAGDLTLLSTIDENEIARLRKTLEAERLARKQRRSSATKEPTETDAVNSTRQSILKNPAPLKSSLRETKSTIPRPASATGDITTRSVATTDGENSLVVPPADRPRRHSVHSLPPNAQRKKRRNMEDMTSAFILPDITLSRAELAASNPTKLPEATRRVLDGIAQHDGKNCMVCKNVHPSDGPCNKEPVNIPKPVPVSQRMPKPSLYNEEPTIRPSQPPAVALAGVLKTLEDELSHLKMQLVSYQGAYNKLDASLGKRQRKLLTEKIETLLKDIDMKSDQIYSLYDVLEGQKQVGREMTEQEMEMTLESIGIDVPADPEVTGTTDKSRGPVEFEEEDDEEFPWEGIESTGELTGRT